MRPRAALLSLAGCVGSLVMWNAHSQPSPCQRLFDQQQEITTCETLLGLYGAKPDDELRDMVSQQVHGSSYAEVQAKRRLQNQGGAKQTTEVRQRKNDDRCGKLFNTDEERDLCRWKGMFTSQYRTDEELRSEVANELRMMANDTEYKQHVLKALSQYSGDAEYARQLQEVEEAKQKRAKEAQRQQIAAAKANAARLDSMLRSEGVGFALRSWQLSGFGNVLIANFWLQNNTSSRVQDFRVTCRTYGESGSALSSASTVLYSALEPRERRSFELNMGLVHSQSAKAACGVVGWK
jgi:hypothetical protein